ncbi:MAG: TonB-dependent receptor [Pseudomonadota bacterium]
MKIIRKSAIALSMLTFFAGQAFAETEELSDLEIIGITPVLGVGLPKEKIPYNVQSSSADDFDRTTSLDITDFMNRNFGSVIVNDAQNNPLQPDIQYRGFTASPLLGLPQGLAVYQNGVRVNEVFGDTINWDLIPEASIHSMNLVGGANPVFGLNTLGGAISIETKNGFNYTGNNLEIYGGYPQERVVFTAESGGNNGTFGYYGLVQLLDEEGWRDASPSDSINLFGAFSYRNGDTTSMDINFNYADNDLIGNGAIPIELANQDYEAIFTSPDQTINEMFMVQAQGEHWLSNTWQLSGNAFYRRNETETFNGDGTEFEECTIDGAEVLIEVDEDELEDAGIDCDVGTTTAALNLAGVEFEIVEDQNGVQISDANGFEPDDFNGLQNRSDRTQEYYGGTFQNVFFGDLFGKQNQLIVGAGYTYGDVVFNSSQELAELNADRSTASTGIFVPEEGTAVDAETFTISLYFTDTMSVTDKLDLTVSGRWNHTDIELTDAGGRGFTDAQPDLTGEHEYNRFNPAVGFTYALQPGLSSYFSYSESSRAPTAVELACADADAPCSLPNGFLADPPLEQVVSKSFEGGFRGNISDFGMLENIGFSIGGFFTTNEDDIIFQNTGGVSGNEGFFDNIGDTERVGVELGLNGELSKFDWFLNYSYISATFESAFESSSANNPSADGDGLIQVQAGDNIPNIPEHTLKLGGDYNFTQRFSVGGDLLYKSGVFVRGDESNQLGELDGYATVNIRGSYQVNDTFKLFARVNNLFDTEYESFGLLGEPDEVPGFDSFTNPTFVGVGAPISGFVGVSASF